MFKARTEGGNPRTAAYLAVAGALEVVAHLTPCLVVGHLLPPSRRMLNSIAVAVAAAAVAGIAKTVDVAAPSAVVVAVVAVAAVVATVSPLVVVQVEVACG